MSSVVNTQLYLEMDRAFTEALQLWERKQADYGPNNVSMAGEAGIALRANDKVQRLRTLLNSEKMGGPKVTPQNESARDSWLDLINYAAMGLLLRDGKWPEPELSAAPARCPHCKGEL